MQFWIGMGILWRKNQELYVISGNQEYLRNFIDKITLKRGLQNYLNSPKSVYRSNFFQCTFLECFFRSDISIKLWIWERYWTISRVKKNIPLEGTFCNFLTRENKPVQRLKVKKKYFLVFVGHTIPIPNMDNLGFKLRWKLLNSRVNTASTPPPTHGGRFLRRRGGMCF